MKTLLKLYIAGQTTKSQDAVKNLHRVVKLARDEVELTIIDVLDSPGLAERDHIIATPVVIREVPAPIRRIVGDLSSLDLVMRELDIVKGERPNE